MTSDPAGTSIPSNSTAPAPTTEPRPTRTLLSTMAPIPIRQSSSMVQPCKMTRCPTVTRCPRCRNSRVGVNHRQVLRILVCSPIEILSVSPRMTALYQILVSLPTSTSPRTISSTWDENGGVNHGRSIQWSGANSLGAGGRVSRSRRITLPRSMHAKQVVSSPQPAHVRSSRQPSREPRATLVLPAEDREIVEV